MPDPTDPTCPLDLAEFVFPMRSHGRVFSYNWGQSQTQLSASESYCHAGSMVNGQVAETVNGQMAESD